MTENNITLLNQLYIVERHHLFLERVPSSPAALGGEST